MATVIVMPALGNSVESCLIVSWLVKEGDTIAENGILCEVETDKASMEVPSTASGTVLKLLWAEGDDVGEWLLIYYRHAVDHVDRLLADYAAASQPATAPSQSLSE